MKKIIFPLLAVAAIVAAPAAYARPMSQGAWNVLADANNRTCYAADRSATPGEFKVSGPYATEAQALAAIGGQVQCDVPNNSD